VALDQGRADCHPVRLGRKVNDWTRRSMSVRTRARMRKAAFQVPLRLLRVVNRPLTACSTVEQGQVARPEAATEAERNLGHSDSAATGTANPGTREPARQPFPARCDGCVISWPPISSTSQFAFAPFRDVVTMFDSPSPLVRRVRHGRSWHTVPKMLDGRSTASCVVPIARGNDRVTRRHSVHGSQRAVSRE
jgi:hypothetical protein